MVDQSMRKVKQMLLKRFKCIVLMLCSYATNTEKKHKTIFYIL